MRYLIKKCPRCGIYTLREKCPRCGSETISPHPPKFNIYDRYVRYRILARREAELNK